MAHEVVHYEPDKGASYGQTVRIRSIERAWKALQHFLATCTIPEARERINLLAYKATEWDDESVARTSIDRTIAHFGQPSRELDGGTRWPSGEPVKGGSYEWDLPESRVDEAVDYLVSGDPWHKQTLGPVVLRFHQNFRWKGIGAPSALPGQHSGHATADGTLRSSVLVTLGPRLFVQPDFWFPFPEGSPTLVEYVAWVQSQLPFRLLPRHFRAAIPRADRSGYVFRKLVLSPTVAA